MSEEREEPTWCILRHWQENGRSARVEVMAEGLTREEMQTYWVDRPQRGPDWVETYYRTS